MSYFGTLAFYLFIIFLSVLITKIAYQKSVSKSQKRILILFVIFLLAVFAGLRYQTGSDWYQYYIAVSKYAANDFLESGIIEKERVKILYNGIEIEKFKRKISL